ncbi:MAG: C10 family peptidase [Sedimentisphaerales bacterium]
MNTLRNLIISLVLLTLISGTVWAKPVNHQEAENAVKGWLKTDSKPLDAVLGQQIGWTDVYNGPDGNPLYYVVYLAPSGFVIMPADNLVEPTICFVAGDASFDPSPENPLGAMVSRDLPSRVDIARKIQARMDSGVKKNLTDEEAVREGEAIKAKGKWDKLQKHADPGILTGLPAVSDIRVAPLTQSRWSQSSVCGLNCYNYYTPNNYVCGCVATAMAQYMRYQQWPTAGIGVHTFTIYVDNKSQSANTRGGDGSGGPYNWGQMMLVPDCSIANAQLQAIGALCYDAGVAAHMQYAGGGSGAYMHDAKAALVNAFQYSNAIMGGNEYSNIGSGLNGMVNPNLDASDPVLLGVYGSGVGHAIVADGYGYSSGTLYHHINMGWNGYDDAWYNLPNIDSSPAFNIVDSCIYNIFTSGHGEIISGRVTDDSGQPLGGATVNAQGPGGPYTATTNANGIYSFAYVGSASTYTVSVTASGYSFTGQNVTTGTSSDGQVTSGNRWGIDFAPGITPPQPPQPPASINYPSSSNSGNYTVSWSSSTGATSYQLERSNNGGSTWSQVYSGANTSYQENVGNGSYRYRVKATNDAGSNGWTTGTSDCVVNIPPPAPPPPTGVSATDGTYADKVNVSWNASAGATSYEVWRNTSNRSNKASKIAEVTSLSYDDTSAVAGTTYWYWVKAKNAAGTSGFSIGDSGYRAKPQPPSPPTNVSASDGTYTDRVRVTWVASNGATSYEIWRGTRSKSTSASKIGEIASSPYDDMSAAAGTTYWYWVKAKNSVGTSGFSSSDSGYRAK